MIEPAGPHRGDQGLRPGRAAEPRRHLCAIEIRPETDPVLPDMPEHVYDVIDDELDRSLGISDSVGAQEGVGKVDADQPPESRMAASCLSVRFLECGLSAWAFAANTQFSAHVR